MRLWLLYVVGSGVLLAGCGGVLSDHPLSDATDSVLDERLIGVWEPVLKLPSAAPETPAPRLYVGKRKGSKRVLEVVTLEINREQHVEVNRFRVYATRVGKVSCLSIADKEGKSYMLARYDIDEKARLRLRLLDEEKVVTAIRAKKIAGRVKEYAKDEKPRTRKTNYEEVRLSASTKTLRVWLQSAPDVWEKVDSDDAHLRKLDFATTGEDK